MYSGIKTIWEESVIETVYTYDEWLKEYNKREQNRKPKKRKVYLYFLIQRFMGMILVSMGFIIPMFCGDGTTSLFIIPIGAYLVLTRKRIIIL